MSTRIKGASLILSIGAPAVDHKVDITSAKITNTEKDADVLTFGDVEMGDDRDFFLEFTATQSTAALSLWRHIWDNAGDEGVPYTYAPHGNLVPSAAEPHFEGTLTIGPPPELGGEAGKTNTYTFDAEWKLDAKPTLDVGVVVP